MHTSSELALSLVAIGLMAGGARAADPVIGKSARYCNPLPMVSGAGGSTSGDVTVMKDNGKCYMYCTREFR